MNNWIILGFTAGIPIIIYIGYKMLKDSKEYGGNH